MAYQILEKESIDITHIDQAVLHNFIANNQSGIIGGYANECSLTSMGNTLIMSTGMLLINGVRVKISEVESVVLSSTPTQDTTYQLIAQLTIDSNQAPSFEFIARTPQALIKNPIGQDGGVGVYQLELARFTHATDGTIKNIVRTANVLYGATNVDLNEIRASVQDARSQAQSAKQEAQAVYELASNAVATSAAAQATAQEAKQIAQQAQEDVRGIEINVAEERGTVVTENGQPKAQVEWNDKLDKTPKEPKVVSDAFLTRITATNDIEIIDSPLGVKTAKIQKIEGLSLKFIQQNGDMHNGTTNWEAIGGTLSVVGGVLRLTLNEDMYDGVAVIYTKPLRKGRKYFIQCYIKPKYSTPIDLGIPASDLHDLRTSPVANRWLYLSGLWTPNTENEEHIQITIDASTNYQVGDVIEIADFRIVDEADSATAWTKAKFDEVVPHLPYFEGIYHSNPAQLKSIGDNLIKFIPKTLSLYGVTMRVDADGTITLNGTSTGAGDFSIISSTAGNIFLKYSILDLKLVVEHISGSFSGGSITVFADGRLINDGTSYYGQQLQCIIPNGSTGGIYTGSINNNRPGYPHHLRVYIGSGRTLNNVKLRVMLLHADNPLTEYKPYNENILQLPQYELPKLPDGTADEIDLTNKAYIKRVGKIVIDGSQEVAQYQANSVGGTYAFYVTIPNYKNKSNTDYVPNILADRLRTLGGETVWGKTYPCVAPYTNGRIVVRDYFLSNAVADAKAYLAQNPITLWFELDEPIIEHLDKDYDATYPAWNYGLEQVFDADGNSAIAQMDIEYPLDLQKQIDTNTWIAQRNEGRIAQIDASKITSGVFDADRIPNLSAEKITSGVFDADRIPNLSAEKITSGVFSADRIPDLSAEKITSGVFSADRIPNLSAEKITSGVFSADRIPNNKILYEGPHDFLEDGDFDTSEYDFSFEDGSTYALEIMFLDSFIETMIFTFESYSDYRTVSFVSLSSAAETYAKLNVGFLRVYTNRITIDSKAGIRFDYVSDNVEPYPLFNLRLIRVIKLR
jgi:hypothetical protein